MIDFSKLRVLTAAERQRDDEQRMARQIEEDLKRRRDWSRKRVTVTLSLEAEFRIPSRAANACIFGAPRLTGRPLPPLGTRRNTSPAGRSTPSSTS